MDKPESQSVKETHKYSKGSRVVCPNPNCCKPIGILTRALKVGDKLTASDINFYGDAYKKGDGMDCKKCGSIWGMNTSDGTLLYVNNGWTRLGSKIDPRKIVRMPKPAIIIPKK